MNLIKEKNTRDWLEKNSRLFVVGFFVLFFILGVSIYKDYGLSWDENSQWKNVGHANYDFIVKHDGEKLVSSGDKYHGPAFEIVLVGIEKVFKLVDSRSIFLMRHLVTFLAFFVSTIAFYLLVLKIFKEKKTALVGCFFYVLNPHVFAHAFYNSKDSVFLSFFTISVYLLIVFYEKRTVFHAFLFALISAFTIDIRIMGIIIPFTFIGIVLIEKVFYFNEQSKQKNGILLLYFLFLLTLIILFWPVLWLNPVHHFAEAFKEAFFYHWDIDVFYMGKVFKSSELPWHYVPFWLFISKPPFYTFLFFVGAFALLKNALTKPILFLKTNQNQLIVLIWVFLPLLMVTLLKSIVFDTGRHLYFLHGGFILIVLFGLQFIFKIIKKKRLLYYFFQFVLFFSLANVIGNMIKLHPYEMLYFNSFAGSNMNEAKNNFEMDYWGVSSRAVLENILQKDSSRQIKIFAENYPAKLNAKILLREQRERLIYTDTAASADYFIANYRWHKGEEYLYQKEVFSVMVGNAKIMTAFKVRSSELLYNKVNGKSLMSFFTDFESAKEWWGNNLVGANSFGAHSGLNTTRVDSIVEYSDGLSIKANNLSNKEGIILKASFWKYDIQPNSKGKFVISVEDKEGKNYFWRAVNETKTNTTLGWEKVECAVELPTLKSENDIIKIYLWNQGKKQILIDDVSINFMEEIN